MDKMDSSEKWAKAYWTNRGKNDKKNDIYDAQYKANKKIGIDEYTLNRYNPYTYLYMSSTIKETMANIEVSPSILAGLELLFEQIYDDTFGCNWDDRWERAVILMKVAIDDVPISDSQQRTRIAERRITELEAENLEMKKALARINKLTK